MSPPGRPPIAARFLGNEAKYASAEARQPRPIVWDRTLVLLFLMGAVAVVSIFLVAAWLLGLI